jgi:glycosyltransferase involved in cell wall biosynthesis
MKRKLQNRTKGLRIAVVSEPLFKYGGAEYHLKEILEAFPDSELFTAFCDTSFTNKYFPHVKIHSSFMQKLPGKFKLRYLYMLLQPLAYRSFRFKGYDAVVSLSMSFAKFVNTGNIKHVDICMTPPKYFWEKEGRTLKQSDKLGGIERILYKMYNFFTGTFLERMWQNWDVRAAQRCTKIVATSKAVRDRVKKYYGLDADIIYPPVDVKNIEKYKKMNRKENWFLYLGRVETYKGVELAIKACIKAKVPLKIAGIGADLDAMQELVHKYNAKGLIKFLGFVSEEEKLDLLARTKALIFPVRHEDFGIVPVEANASGTPVIAFREGGVLETISERNPKTGIFFEKYNTNDLYEVIRDFKSSSFNPDNCKKQANNFASEIFVYKLQNYIKDVLQSS